ncbi:phage tail protein [Sellimonas intestinalis]|uniref:phage tail protein n=1 Tax=Sellimonas intestinalis TaxID=1653434 RepID=UPI00248DFE9D|nr:hypothetical protein [Sellimonas intestinalis]
MDSIRIAILSANNTPVAFMDNAHKKSMHYWGDELHEYLQGTANTYTFTVNAKHPDAEHVTVGNKVAFTYKGKSYYLNIVNTDQTEKIITATAWSLSFELINEDAGEYKAGKAMSFEEYLAIFDAERTLKLGLNEVSDKRITNEWTGTTSVLKRLFSLANVFSAEIEFETVLNRDYSLKEIVLNVYRKHSDTDSGVGEYRNDIVLRYGKGITGIRKTTDAEKLYTCIQPTGKDGLTINGLDKKEYDENGNIEYFTDGAIIRAPQARDRFPSNIVNKEDAYILMRKEYDTDNKDKLYSMALSDIKTASEPVVTYEVDGYFDTNIGDIVRMQDQEWTPTLYLQARVSEQVRSLTNPKTAKTVFTNYKELMSEISSDLLDKMQELINKTKVYTCSIATNNGIIFKNGVGSTTLTAYAYNNGVDVSGSLEIRWSKDGNEFYVGRSVTVNAEDVDVKAVYSFTAYENGVKRGYYEVTVTDVSDGEPGKDGTTYYTWFKFADDEYGNGMSSSPDGKEYLGIAYNKETPVMSNNPEDYQWARITGEGIPGEPGKDGKTYYTWVRYADDARGNGMSDSPNGKYYIGFAYNKEVPTESNNPADYQWSKYKGDDGKDGTDGAIKSETPPDDKTKLWYDTVNNVLKYWDGEKWVEAYTGDIEDAKDAAGNAQESANTAISSVNNINTSLEKYKNEVRAEFKNTVTYVDGKTEVIDTWVRQGSDGVTPFLELGGTSNDLKARLTNSRLGFYEGDKGLAYFGNEKAYMPVAEVDNLSAKRVGVGNYAMLDNGDGHLSIIYIE